MPSHWNVASENEVVTDSWRVELVKGNAGELRVLEPTVIELVIKRWRAELLEVARACDFVLEPL